MDNIKREFQNINSYQLEDVIDLLAYMKHIPSILNKFYDVAITTGKVLICYFQDSLKPSIRTQ